MTWAIDVYYSAPPDAAREERIAGVVARHIGSLDFRELPKPNAPPTIVLTYEFAEMVHAEAAANELMARREHVEGPYPYG